jgi:hypothetical protein
MKYNQKMQDTQGTFMLQGQDSLAGSHFCQLIDFIPNVIFYADYAHTAVDLT